MKVIIAKKHFRGTRYEGFIRRGEQLRVTDQRAEALVSKGIAVYKEHNIKMPEITTKQNGAWFEVFKDGEKIDKVHGKKALKERYGI